jgi:hypothetical protein
LRIGPACVSSHFQFAGLMQIKAEPPLGLTLLGPDGRDPSFRAPRVDENVNEKIWAVAFGLTSVGLIEA